MSRLDVTVFAFCGLLALSVYGQVPSNQNRDQQRFGNWLQQQNQWPKNSGDQGQGFQRNNGGAQGQGIENWPKEQNKLSNNGGNQRQGLQGNNGNNRPNRPNRPTNQNHPNQNNQNQNQAQTSTTVGQWFNNGNQNPQTEQQSFGNWPQQQNQWPNNGDNQGQGFQGNNGDDQGQGFGNWPQEQNQWSNNGGNQGQGLQGNNVNNRPNRLNRPTNQNNQNQNNQNQNQNQAQTSSAVVSENQRNECNTRCKGRVTSDFNPVCGNDGQTYQNTRFLNCVADCGIQTEFSYVGTCVPSTQPSVVNPGSSNNSRT